MLENHYMESMCQPQENEFSDPHSHEQLVQKAKHSVQMLREQTKQMQNDVNILVSEEEQDEEFK